MSSRGTGKLDLLFLCVAVAFVALAVAGGFRSYSPVPFWDMWDGFVAFQARLDAGDRAAWWDHHNEHRIVLTRLLFALDLRLFSGSGKFLIAANYLLTGVACAIFWRIWKELAHGRDAFVACFLVALLFSWAQQVNFTWGFQGQMLLAKVVPLAAFYGLYRSTLRADGAPGSFAVAALLGVASIGTMANGVLALPLMTLYACLVRLGTWRTLLLALLSVTCVTAYFHGFQFAPGQRSVLELARENPSAVVTYVLLYLGGPLCHFLHYFPVDPPAIRLAGLAAGTVFVACAALCTLAVLRAPRAQRLPLALCIYLAYVLATAFAMAGGRSSAGVEQAMSSRYMTGSLMAWGALLLLFVPRLHGSGTASRSRLGVALAIAVLLMLPMQIKALFPDSDELFERSVAGLALDLGVRDGQQIRHVYPSAEKALDLVSVLQQRNVFFVHPASGPVAGDSSAIRPMPPQGGDSCAGHLDELLPVDGDARYLRIRGWLFAPGDDHAPGIVHILDPGGNPVGAALSGQRRADVARSIASAPADSGFKGYIRGDRLQSGFVLVDAGSGCRLDVRVAASPGPG